MSWFQRTPPAHDHPPNPSEVGWEQTPSIRARARFWIPFLTLGCILLFFPTLRYSICHALGGQSFTAPGNELLWDPGQQNITPPTNIASAALVTHRPWLYPLTPPYVWDFVQRLLWLISYDQGAWMGLLVLAGIFSWPIFRSFKGLSNERGLETKRQLLIKTTLFFVLITIPLWMAFNGADYLPEAHNTIQLYPGGTALAAGFFVFGLLSLHHLCRWFIYLPFRKIPFKKALGLNLVCLLVMVPCVLFLGEKSGTRAIYVPFQGWDVVRQYPGEVTIRWTHLPWNNLKIFDRGLQYGPLHERVRVTRSFPEGCQELYWTITQEYPWFSHMESIGFIGVHLNKEKRTRGTVFHFNSNSYSATSPSYMGGTEVFYLDHSGALEAHPMFQGDVSALDPGMVAMYSQCVGGMKLDWVASPGSYVEFQRTEEAHFPWEGSAFDLFFALGQIEGFVFHTDFRPDSRIPPRRVVKVKKYRPMHKPPKVTVQKPPEVLIIPLPHPSHPHFPDLQKAGYIDESGEPVPLADPRHPKHQSYYEWVKEYEEYQANHTSAEEASASEPGPPPPP